MANWNSNSNVSISRLIIVPSVIALALTVLRLVGELQHWSPTWFSPEPGGIEPTGVSWIIGITWLGFPFGVYFAMKLARSGQGPKSAARAVALAVLCSAIFVVGMKVIVPRLSDDPNDFQSRLIIIWASSAVPAAITFLAWPQLWKTMLAYGLASRIPVAIIMFVAMRGNWGTHYDYGGVIPPDRFGEYYIWLALVPQLVFWVAFTILSGMLTGSITAALLRRGKPVHTEGAYGAAS